MGLGAAIAAMTISFAVLVRSADWLVEGAVGVAQHLKVSPMLIGIVIVSMGTTAPELAVSISAALGGQPEIALGNAVGSVIYDDGIALPLVALFSPVVVTIDRFVLRYTAVFLIAVDLFAYWLCADGVLSQGEGMLLVLGFGGYLAYTYRVRSRSSAEGTETQVEQSGEPPKAWGRISFLFLLGLTGVLVSSELIVVSAPILARAAGVSNTIIGLLVIAFGTSVPEIATCVAAARRRQGSLAVGNILGADILNICWIAGASAMVNDLVVAQSDIHFMFPSMIIIVGVMLALLRLNYRFEKWKGGVLLLLCVVYLIALWSKNPGSV